jgi:hypothetical protein
MKPKIIILVIAIMLASFGVAMAQGSNACWGQATAVFAQMGEMGEHASQQPTPRLGLANLAEELYEAGVIPDDSIQALGEFVADSLGLTIDACMDSNGAPRTFRAHLSGDQEVPSVDTDASGVAVLRLSGDGDALNFKLIVANIDNVLFSHIHFAPPGTNGPVVAFLFDGGPTGPVNGVLAEGIITADDLIGPLTGLSLQDLIDVIEAGNTYVNVHTLDNPPGEIRGQIQAAMP